MRQTPWLGVLLVLLSATVGWSASSRDYPGPCFGESNAAGVPLYLSSDYRGANPVFGVIVLNATGRLRLGISCVATGFTVFKVGPDSAMCTLRGRCTPDQLQGVTEADIEAVRFLPNEVPFFHICQRHSFGWYDATGVPAGIYVAAAKSVSAVWGLVQGHGTMDTYAYAGNGGVYQPVNCPPPPVCGNWIVEPGESCDDGNAVDGDCCSATCGFESAGSACASTGDLCTPGLCNGAGTCQHANACVDQLVDGVLLRLERKYGREKLLWTAKNLGNPSTPNPALNPTQTGAVLEMFAPDATPVSMALPAAGWSGGNGVFKFSNRSAPDGISSVRVVALNQGRTIKILARRTGFPLTNPLPGVGVRLVAGTVATCSFFPASSVVTDVPGKFEARGPGAIATSCDRTTLSQGVPGGELNPGLPPEDPGDPGGGWCGGGGQNLRPLPCPY